jgi:hypothetical protein
LGAHEFWTERGQEAVTAHTKLVIGNTDKNNNEAFTARAAPHFVLATMLLNSCPLHSIIVVLGQRRTRIIAARAL